MNISTLCHIIKIYYIYSDNNHEKTIFEYKFKTVINLPLPRLQHLSIN